MQDEYGKPHHFSGKETAVSIRLFTTCALALTASAVAGLLVGGFIVASDRTPAPTPQVAQVAPAAGASGQ